MSRRAACCLANKEKVVLVTDRVWSMEEAIDNQIGYLCRTESGRMAANIVVHVRVHHHHQGLLSGRTVVSIRRLTKPIRGVSI